MILFNKCISQEKKNKEKKPNIKYTVLYTKSYMIYKNVSHCELQEVSNVLSS